MQLQDADWPVFGWTTDMRPSLGLARREQRTIVLGTIVGLSGPAPRPIGSQMTFQAETAVGYFSGGCIEADVANHAQAVLEDGAPRRLVYGEGSPWLDIRLLCGGRIEILLEAIEPYDPAVASLLQLATERRPAWWSSDGRVRSVSPSPTAYAPGDHYVVRHDPEWRVVVIGGDPVALATARLAHQAGFQTFLIRPGGPAASPVVDGISYLRGDVVGAIADIGLDHWTAVVTANHDDELDDRAVSAALIGKASYVGVLGSAVRTAARRERLRAIGLPETRIAALHSPIGAVRTGKAPWDIAVSIVAEIMAAKADSDTQCRASGEAAGNRHPP